MISFEDINLCALLLSGLFLAPFSYLITQQMKSRLPHLGNESRPEGIDQHLWSSLFGTRVIEKYIGSKLIGRVEIVLFFLAMIFDIREAIPAWLAFKVASKWETWSNVFKIPSTLGDQNVSDIDFLKVRIIWGLRIMDRFLYGTLLNILGAFLAVFIYYLLSSYKISL